MSDTNTVGSGRIGFTPGSSVDARARETSIRKSAWIDRQFRRVPHGQFGRYLMVGVWNTLFGYGVFAAFVAVLEPRIRYGYVLANFLASALTITIAFLGYKWFVFKTKGNYLREWLRCLAVYSGSVVLGTLLLPVIVQLLRYGFGMGRSAPYLGGALLLVGGVLSGFWGHRRFSFQGHTTDRASGGDREWNAGDKTADRKKDPAA